MPAKLHVTSHFAFVQAREEYS